MTTTGIANTAYPRLEFSTSDANGNPAKIPAVAMVSPAGDPVDPVDAPIVSTSVSAAATILTIDTQGYAAGSFQITSVGTGNTIVFEQSNDNTNWLPLSVNSASASGATYQTNAVSTGMFSYSATARYIRARVSIYGTGTVSVTAMQKRGRAMIENAGATLNYQGYTDTAIALGVSAAFTGSVRNFQYLTSPWITRFNVRAYADQPGNLYIDQSLDGTTSWQTIATVAVTANTPQILTALLTGSQSTNTALRVRYVNGGAAQTLFRLSSSFTST